MNASAIRARAMGGKRLDSATPTTLPSITQEDGTPIPLLQIRMTPDDMRAAREAATSAKGDLVKGIPDTISNERMMTALGVRVITDLSGAQVFQVADLDSLMTLPVGADLMAVGMRVSKAIQAAGN